MKSLVIFLGLSTLLSLLSNAQSYVDSIFAFREKYKKEFLEDNRSPLKEEDFEFLRFYKPDPTYIVKASFTQITDTSGFDMQTHNGVIKKYYVYGKLQFRLKKKACTLFIYQSDKLRTQAGFEDYLFIPFTDNTNYKTTFGGGRYLDIRMNEIKEGKLVLDFNKCYNPYCAFKEGYACPIPPKENDLKISIEAGEKLFGKEVKE